MAITSYEVGAVFRISDQATAPLLKISAELARVDEALREGFELARAFRQPLSCCGSIAAKKHSPS